MTQLTLKMNVLYIFNMGMWKNDFDVENLICI